MRALDSRGLRLTISPVMGLPSASARSSPVSICASRARMTCTPAPSAVGGPRSTTSVEGAGGAAGPGEPGVFGLALAGTLGARVAEEVFRGGASDISLVYRAERRDARVDQPQSGS